ncbi:cytochrome c [Paracoccus xiamenensis]|uniref:cytochrome c n=1 Tax=Paracoccus xiamenensis TaxID=2714901 RepID=UPI00140A4EF1|nr:cytochrome c [Paracoccus xiamenensis]NHF72000.1 cytochrome c [Paracoccus xiamenensis]
MRLVLILLLAGTAATAETPGEALFLRGEGAQAIIGGGAVRLPASRFACAGCHGADGDGRAEGGTAFPPIHWSALTQRPTPYDAEAVLRVLRDGRAPDGRMLNAAMPRYDAQPEVMDSLIAYLQGLEAARDAILPDRIQVLRSGNDALDQGFAAAAERFNASGGAYGRQMVLTETGPGVPLSRLADEAAPAITEACLNASMNALKQAGASQFALLGGSPADIAYRAEATGLTLAKTAPSILALEPPGNVAAGQHFYGCIDILGPAAADLVTQGAQLTIALPDRAAFDWARAGGHDWQAMRGFTLGGLLGQAARDAGRRTTQDRLIEAARSLHVAVETVSLP